MFLLVLGQVCGLQLDGIFYVTPTPSNPDCPVNFPCHTLNDYALHSETYFDLCSNITLVLLSGTHNLTTHSLVLENREYVKIFSAHDLATVLIGRKRSILFKNITTVSLRHMYVSSLGLDDHIRNISVTMVSFYQQAQTNIFGLTLSILNVPNIEITDSNFNESSLDITLRYNNSDLTSGKLTITNCSMYSLHVRVMFSLDIVGNGKPWAVTVNQSNFTSSLVVGFSQAIYSTFTNSPADIRITDCVLAQTMYGIQVINSNCNTSLVFERSKIIGHKNGVWIFSEENSSMFVSLFQSIIAENKDGILTLLSDQSEIVMLIDRSIIANQTNDGISLNLCSKKCNATFRIVKSTVYSCSKAGVEIIGYSRYNSRITVKLDVSQTIFAENSFGVFSVATSFNILLYFNHVSFVNTSSTTFLMLLSVSEEMKTLCTLTLENCVFVSNSGPVLDIELNEASSTQQLAQKNSLEHCADTRGTFVTIYNCTFRHNIPEESLIKIDASSVTTPENAPLVLISNSKFVHNQLANSGDSVLKFMGYISDVAIDTCLFQNNIGTPITVIHTHISVKGNNIFQHNEGFRGAGISLIDSQLILSKSTTIVFWDNFATDVGGALYIVKDPYGLGPQKAECFYQIPAVSDIDFIALIFSNNTAERGGNAIYGASLHDDCVVTRNGDPRLKSIDVFKKVFNIFNMSDSLVSSDPKRVCLCSPVGEPACANINYILTANQEFYPGEEFTVSAVVVGDEFGTLTSTIYATILGTLYGKSSSISLGTGQSVQAINLERCSTLTYSLHSLNMTNGTLVFKADQTTTSCYGDSETLDLNLWKYKENKVIPELL